MKSHSVNPQLFEYLIGRSSSMRGSNPETARLSFEIDRSVCNPDCKLHGAATGALVINEVTRALLSSSPASSPPARILQVNVAYLNAGQLGDTARVDVD